MFLSVRYVKLRALWDKTGVCLWALCDQAKLYNFDNKGAYRKFDPSILRHSGIWGAADEAVLNIVQKIKNPKISGYCL